MVGRGSENLQPSLAFQERYAENFKYLEEFFQNHHCKSTNLVFYMHCAHNSTNPQEFPTRGAHHATNVSSQDVLGTATLELKGAGAADISPICGACQPASLSPWEGTTQGSQKVRQFSPCHGLST